MNHVCLYALNIFLVAFEFFCMVHLANGFFKRKNQKVGIYYVSMLATGVLIIVELLLLAEHPLVNLICWVVLCSIWISLCFESGFVRSLFLSAFLGGYLHAVDDLFLSLSVLYGGAGGVSVLEDPFAFYTLAYCAKVVELFGIALIHKWAIKRNRTGLSSWTDWLRVLVFPVTALIAAFLMTRALFSAPELSGVLLGCITSVLVADMLSMYLLNSFEKQQETIRANIALQHSLKLESEHVESIQRAYSRQRKQTHDFQNQLAVLRNLAACGASQREFTDYLNRILETEFEPPSIISTNRLIADVILNQEYSSARNKDIIFRTELTDLEKFPLSDDALVVVLTNLLDNANEACDLLGAEQERYILLKMRISSNAAYLYVENPTRDPVKIVDHYIATTKAHPLEHGYGLKNIYAILDQYEAAYAIEYRESDSVFCFSAQLALQ